MDSKILETIRERGLLLERDIYELVEKFGNIEQAKYFLDNLERATGQKIITKGVLSKNIEFVKSAISNLPGKNKSVVENIFFKLGISLEIRQEKVIEEIKKDKIRQDYQVFYADTKPDKKLEVKDFTGHFRARYQALQAILMRHPELNNLVSINKISSDRKNLSIIGIVSEKRVTKNNNLIITFEDLTGKVTALVKFDREEVIGKARELQLDDVVGVKASGSSEILFVHDIIFPDAFILEKMKFEQEGSIAFISDIHTGSGRHLGKNFEKFLEWINSEDEDARKIKYLFLVGDNVDGVGIFPGQESVLELKSMKEQYHLLASYLRKVPKNITMFMCPGQHDAVRVAEPQPIIDRRYAPELYEIENLVLVTNPTLVKLIEGDKEFKVLMYHGASIHSFINNIQELRELKAHSCPARAVRHMLKRRHLAPSHSEVVYIPNTDLDPMVISEVPDVLCTGEVHRLDIDNYNGVLIITGSCWQAQTQFEEKIGNIPDPCKVPVLNLKTRELKVFYFGEEE